MLPYYTDLFRFRGRFMPKKYKDKVLAHILVLALIVEHYELNCNLLLKDLKLSVNRYVNFSLTHTHTMHVGRTRCVDLINLIPGN